MLTRYARPEMTTIWSEERRFQLWAEVEVYVCQALAELGYIPTEAAQDIHNKLKEAHFDPHRIEALEKITKHDVIAFLTHAGEFLGPESRFLHQGMTSSDLLDTTLSLQLTAATDVLLEDLDLLLTTLKKRAYEHQFTPCIGRSHGMHAEPTTFGLKMAQAHAEFSRGRHRLAEARKEIAICSISGTVGTFSTIPPEVELYVAKKLNLQCETISTQIIPRDRHAVFFSVLGLIAASLERLSIEIRHLQRTEVREVEEFFSEGQKGSSAMPHKRNPILSENVTGLARMVRSFVTPALENVILWHERDISHSAAERFMGPDATITLDFALRRMNKIMGELQIYPANMKKNLNLSGGLFYSQRILLALTQKGISREMAYDHVQRNAMQVLNSQSEDKPSLTFLESLQKDPALSTLFSSEELQKLCEPDTYFDHVETIFERVFGPRLGTFGES